jgi:hypothetical protein
MEHTDVHRMSERYTGLSDRFRSLWTFYQFLGGVFKHRGDGQVPYVYDFQALYRRLQELVPRMGVEGSDNTLLEFEQMERELGRIHSELSNVEVTFPPSLLRRFFDHLKRQDEKILFALTKFYLFSDEFKQDTLDKLDILMTRLAEAPVEGGQAVSRDATELRSTFARLASFAGIPEIPQSDAGPLVEAVRDFRSELRAIEDFQELIDSRVYDRYRKLKQRLGTAFLHPPILVEVVITNIEAKNQFARLYREEEVRILEETNRVFEIERFLERNPEATHEELTRQIEEFRESRSRFDNLRREDNIKREDILSLRQSMNAVIEGFERIRGEAERAMADQPQPQPPPDPPPFQAPFETHEDATHNLMPAASEPSADPFPPETDFETVVASDSDSENASITDLLPPDPLLSEPLHKIMFAIEMVAWDRSPDRVIQAPELHNLHLEAWEVESYRDLVQRRVSEGTTKWELHVFFLRSAALRVKMEEEREEIQRLHEAANDERAFEILERSAQSLERAREVDRRFQWFIDDMLYGGDTELLEQLYRSRFRFLNAYSALWLEHQAHGGLTPL